MPPTAKVRHLSNDDTPPAMDAERPARTKPGAKAPAGRPRTRGSPDPVAALEGVPGIGPATAERILRAAGGKDELRRIVDDGDVMRIAAIQGIGEAKAVDVVRALQDPASTAASRRLFGTDRVRKVFETVRDRIVERAVTDQGRNRLRLLGPLADRAAREASLQDALDAAAEVQDVDLEEARQALRRIHPVPERKPAFEATVVVFVDKPADRSALIEAGIDRWAPIASAYDRDRIAGVEAGVYAFTDGGSSLLEAEQVLSVPFSTDPAVVVPWAETMRWQKSRNSLEASATLSELRGTAAPSREALEILQTLEGLDADFDPARLETRVQEVFEHALVAAETGLEELTLTGRDLVRALSAAAPEPVRRVYKEAMASARETLRQETGLTFDPFTETVPPTIDDGAVRAARHKLEGRGALVRLEAQAKAARELVKLKPRIDAEIADHLAFDARQALGDYVSTHRLTAPHWSDRFEIDGALHLDHSPHGERIAYALGGAHRLALLTGANSGGKTTLLETMCQILTLAHAGLPVPAEHALVPEVDTIHFFAQKRSLSAGAFEDFLVRFFPVAADSGRVFVLADEVEAMTELEASAEIIAAFLERLHARDAHAVFVSHMGPHVLPRVNGIVRVDGIEATGLDDAHNLIVSRTPRLGHLARSTPELILRRLSKAGPEGLRATFEELAARVARNCHSSGVDGPGTP